MKACKGCEFYRTFYGQSACMHPTWARRSPAEMEGIQAGTYLCGYDTRRQHPTLTEHDHTPWRDPKTGRVYVVSCGFSKGRNWYTAHAQVRGGRPRFTSPALPVRYTREEALENLRRYAEAKGWGEVRQHGQS